MDIGIDKNDIWYSSLCIGIYIYQSIDQINQLRH